MKISTSRRITVSGALALFAATVLVSGCSGSSHHEDPVLVPTPTPSVVITPSPPVSPTPTPSPSATPGTTTFAVTDIGQFNGTAVGAYGFNDAGQVVGVYARNRSSAFVYTGNAFLNLN